MTEQKGSEPEAITVPEYTADKGSLNPTVEQPKVGMGSEPEAISGESDQLFGKDGKMSGKKPVM